MAPALRPRRRGHQASRFLPGGFRAGASDAAHQLGPQRAACVDRYPEFDAIGIFREIIAQHSTDFTRALSAEKREQLPRILAETHRAASRFRLQAYPGVEETIRQLHPKYHLAIISDGQTAYAGPQMETHPGAGVFFFFFLLLFLC